MEKVSIIVPTYKRSEFIYRAIESLLNQSHDNIEVIVVDDNGSNTPERTAMQEKMKKYEQDHRVSYIENEKNVGGALARNRGIDVATGKYITFLDDDDEYLPTKIEVQYNEMKENRWEVSVMDGATYNIEGKLLSEKKQEISCEPGFHELIVSHLVHHITNTNTFMYEANALKRIGGFDNVVAGQEYMLMLKTINEKLKFGYIPQTLVACYIHEGERLSTGNKKLKAEKILIREKRKYFEYLNRTQRRLVLCRHHGVVFYVQIKMKNYVMALGHAMLAVLYSPRDTYKLFNKYKGKLSQ